MKRKLKALRAMRYGTRRLVAGDLFDASRGDAKVLTKLNRAVYADEDRAPAKLPPIPESVRTRAMAGNVKPVEPVVAPTVDPRGALRAEYEKKVGRRPYYGWDAAELQRRIDEASKEGE